MEKIMTKNPNDGGPAFPKINPIQVERDQYGMWTHPDFPDSDDEYIPRSWFSDRGLEFAIIEFESDGPENLLEKWFGEGSCDCSEWDASKPDGDGWFIFSIHDTDDGPICVWVREVSTAAREVLK